MNGLEDIQKMMDRTTALRELLDYCNKWLGNSKSWRQQSYEEKWHNYQRDADAIYDPTIKAAKEKWQSKAFIPMIPSHRETLQANLYKTEMGARPLLDVKGRGTIEKEADQSENIRDLILREVEKSRLEAGYNGTLDDATTYGSGFARIIYQTKTDDRRVRTPQFAPVDPNQIGVQAQQGQLPPQPQPVGYTDAVKEVLIYRGVTYTDLSSWDVYPDPRALQIKGSSIAIKYPVTYGEIVKGAQKGYFFPEAVDILKNVIAKNDEGQGKRQMRADRKLAEPQQVKTDYGQEHDCYEFYARLPQKWIYAYLSEPIDPTEPEKLVPARVIFHHDVVLGIELNDQYDGEPPIYKRDYMPVKGQFYGRGIPEMLGGLQDVLNEGVNARIDFLGLSINSMFAVIEKYLVNSQDLKAAPNQTLRFDAKAMRADGFSDVRQVFQKLELGNLDRSAFIDPQEMERYAQERTSASKITLGTAGQTRDTNDTAHGMELLKQVTNEKMAYVGMLGEFNFWHEVFRAYWKNIYSNIQPQDVVDALGEERTQTFKLLTPEEIEQDYRYEPQGIWTQENKGVVQQRLAAIYQQFPAQMYPWVKPESFFDKEMQSVGEQPDGYRMTPDELYQHMMAQGQMQMPPQVPQQGPAQQGPQEQPPQGHP